VLASRVAQAGPFIVQGPAVPTDLVNFGRVQNLPILLGVGLGGLALATIAHLLVTSVRRRRRDFAILRTLGFTRWQVRRTVAWQAATLAGIALVIGLPLGIVGGRAGWQIFSHQLGIQPVFDIPLGQFAAMIPLALGLAVAIAALPGESAARVRPAQVLRSE
jgi:putative ABC transport system permease protein